MRQRIRASKVDLLPITVDLLGHLEPLAPAQRRAVFAKAKVPMSSLSAWASGQYHPGAEALSNLYRALGRKLTSEATAHPKDP